MICTQLVASMPPSDDVGDHEGAGEDHREREVDLDEALDQHARADHLRDQVEGDDGQRAERRGRAGRLLLEPERRARRRSCTCPRCACARRAGTARSGTRPGSRRSTGSRRTRTGRSGRRCRGTTRPTCSRRRSRSRSADPVSPRPAAQKSVAVLTRLDANQLITSVTADDHAEDRQSGRR